MPKSLQSPGAVLQSLLDQYHLNPNRLGKEIKLSQSAVRQIVIGKARISAPVALRLAKYFGKKAEYWLDLQAKYDISAASKDKKLAAVLKAVGDVKKFVPKPITKKAGPRTAAAAKITGRGAAKKPARAKATKAKAKKA
jgi:addiction module HigA family antidote